MSKRNKTYIVLIVITLLGIAYAEMSKPKDINWFESYSSHHKIPFGSYIFRDLLDTRFDSIVYVNRPPYEYLNSHSIEGTYLFFNDGLGFGEAELKSLLDWTSAGNTLILASNDFEYSILDTLNLDTDIVSIPGNFSNEFELALVHPDLKSEHQILFDRAITLFHFSEIDTSSTKVVGLIDNYQDSQKQINDTLINIIKQPFGNGEIVLSTFPQAFSNYFILEGWNREYTAGIMSYINSSKPLYLDAYYKSGKSFYASPLYLFLNNPNLKWAYYILLIGAFIYVLFEGKRKQRAIPIIRSLRNQTVDYTRTISNMYYERGAHTEIAQHKIQHFLNYIRANMHLPTSIINDQFLNQLAARSNNDLEDVTKLFEFLEKLQEQGAINKEELQELNSSIETFKSNNRWKTKR